MIEKTIHVELRPNEVILTTNTERKIRRVIPKYFIDGLSLQSLLLTYDEMVETARVLKVPAETLELIDCMRPSIRQVRLVAAIRKGRSYPWHVAYDKIASSLDNLEIPYTETTPRKWVRKSK